MVSELPRDTPTETQAEAMVLSAMMLNSEAAANVIEILGNDLAAFTEAANGCLYRVLSELWNENKPLDDTLIKSRIKSLGFLELTDKFLEDIIGAAPTHHMAEYHAITLLESASRRRMISALSRATRDCYESSDSMAVITDRIESSIFSQQQTDSTNAVGIAQAIDDLIHAGEAAPGINTGFVDLDKLLCGLHAGEMIVLAARPSVGKTMLALNIAEHVSASVPTAFFSLEMKTDELLRRLICSRSAVDLQKMRRNILSPLEREAMGAAMMELREAELYIDDASSLTLMQFRAKARRLVKKHKIKLVILDYLQLMDASEKSENRQQEITRISRGIKTIAKELDVAILCLSQLNRASETEQRRPRSSDLRESGAIEQDADVVLLLHREDFMHRAEPEWLNANPQLINVAEVIIAKQRSGPCGVVKLTARPSITRFENHFEQ